MSLTIPFAVPVRVRQEGWDMEGVRARGPRPVRRRPRRGQEEVQDALRRHRPPRRPPRRGAEARQGEARRQGEGQAQGQAGMLGTAQYVCLCGPTEFDSEIRLSIYNSN